MTTRRQSLSFFASALALTACAPLPGPGPVSRRAHDSEGGIGGTGIYGPVSLSPDLTVAGLALRLSPALRPAPVIDPGAVVSAVAELAEGEAEVVAIAPVVALQGPVTTTGGELRVLGAPVALSAATVSALGAPVASLSPGDRVAVSGLWDGGLLHATRVAAAPDGLSAVTGQAFGTAPGQAAIGGVPLTEPAGEPARFVAAAGRWTGEALEVTRLRRRPSGPFPGPVRAARVEAFAAVDDTVGLHLSGLALPVSPSGAEGLAPGRRVVVTGRLDNSLTLTDPRRLG